MLKNMSCKSMYRTECTSRSGGDVIARFEVVSHSCNEVATSWTYTLATSTRFGPCNMIQKAENLVQNLHEIWFSVTACLTSGETFVQKQTKQFPMFKSGMDLLQKIVLASNYSVSSICLDGVHRFTTSLTFFPQERGKCNFDPKHSDWQAELTWSLKR